MKKITFLVLNLFLLISVSAFAVTLPVQATINGAIPTGWTYITNNASYPNPEFYTTPQGLKMKFEGQGIASPVFDAQNSVQVTLTVGSLNENTKTGSSTNYFTITGFDASDAEVAVGYLTSVSTGANSVVLTGTGIVRVEIIMTGYPYNGSKYCNVNLSGVSIAANAVTAVVPTYKSKFNVYVAESMMYVHGVENGTSVEVYSLLGARVLVSKVENGAVALNDLSKGVYVVRVGRNSKKIVL